MCAMLVGVMSMRPVCVIGLGLIGGSLLRDLHAKGWPVFGFNRSPSAVKQACDEGFDASSCLEDTLQRAEREGALIVLATPMPAIPSMLDAVMEHAPSCGITDVVSVKTEVYSLVCERGLQDRYVGGHPMAGTANSGWEAAHEGLFQGAAWVVTFDQAAEDPEGVSEQWVGLWRDVATVASAVGAEVIPARVGVHDAAVARISHLPHVSGTMVGRWHCLWLRAVSEMVLVWRVRCLRWCARCARPTMWPCWRHWTRRSICWWMLVRISRGKSQAWRDWWTLVTVRGFVTRRGPGRRVVGRLLVGVIVRCCG